MDGELLPGAGCPMPDSYPGNTNTDISEGIYNKMTTYTPAFFVLNHSSSKIHFELNWSA